MARSHMLYRWRLAGAYVAIGIVATCAGNAHAQDWGYNGVAVCDSCYPWQVEIVPDGQHGVIAVWNDGINDTTIWAQHMVEAGARAANWPPHSFPAAYQSAFLFPNQVVSDGAGGAFVGVSSTANLADAFVQHILVDGTIPADWPTQAAPVATSPHYEAGPNICLGQGGGLYAAYWDATVGVSSVQHVTAAGSPAPGWPLGGLSVGSVPGTAGGPQPVVVSDGSNGAIVAWCDRRAALSQFDGDIYAQRFQSDGSRSPGWIATGMPVCTAPMRQFVPQLLADGSGGTYVVWEDSRSEPASLYYFNDIYMTRLLPDGSIAPGWPVNGRPVVTADGYQKLGALTEDGAGGLFVVWEDQRSVRPGVYVQHVRSDGSVAPGWPADGFSVSTVFDYLDEPRMCADAAGGVYVTFMAENSRRAYIQHLAANGQPAPGWPATGQASSDVPNSGAQGPRVCSDDRGGAIMAWDEVRFPSIYSLYAQHYAADGATAVLASLVSAEARDGVVSLAWELSNGGVATASVERRTLNEAWQAIGTANVQERGRLAYEDRSASPGTRYAYRLRYDDAGQPRTSAEAWVNVPALAQLSLAGLRPNPATGANLQVAFTLPSSAPARLELLDIAGRRIAGREVGSLGAGSHVEPLEAGARVPAGLYWLRLTQGSRALVVRAVVAG